jgi:thiamine biosynthesis lipoprotein
MAAQRKSNRRQFLTGGAAIEALREVVDAADPASVPAAAGDPAGARPAPAVGAHLLKIGRRAMACEFEVVLNANRQAVATEVAIEVLDLIDALEDQLTVYRGHSEVSQINRRAADERVLVETRLAKLLAEAVRLNQVTDGAFDITAGPLVKVWGFYRRQGRVPAEGELRQALQLVGARWLELDVQACTIHFARPGMEINLGGIGKGYALDRCAERLREAGVDDFLLHGGLSSVLAHGSRADARDSGGGWTVGIRHPLRPQRRLAEVCLRDRALGTSGSGTQHFHHRGRRYGHILDPRTGQPAEGVLSATVLAPTAAVADALATALCVLGLDRSKELIARHPSLAALLVGPGSRSGAVELHTFGLDDQDWRPIEP